MHFSQAVAIIQSQVGTIRGVQVLYSDTVSLIIFNLCIFVFYRLGSLTMLTIHINYNLLIVFVHRTEYNVKRVLFFNLR